MTHRIAIFVFDGSEELDWVGPWEVLAAWMEFWPEEVQVFTVADPATTHWQSLDLLASLDYLKIRPSPRPVALPAIRRPTLRPTRPFFTAFTSPRKRASA